MGPEAGRGDLEKIFILKINEQETRLILTNMMTMKFFLPLPAFEPRIIHPVASSLYRLSCHDAAALKLRTKGTDADAAFTSSTTQIIAFVVYLTAASVFTLHSVDGATTAETWREAFVV
jgi:hypothetical protein